MKIVTLLPYKEDYTPLAKHPYEVSKLICENICKNYSVHDKILNIVKFHILRR